MVISFITLALPAQATDLSLTNGKIITVDSRDTIAQAIAIRNGKIDTVSNTADIQKLAYPKTKVIDLNRKAVTKQFRCPQFAC